MGRVTVPQRMRTDATVFPIELFENSYDDTLNGRLAHRFVGSRGLGAVFSFGGEDPFFVPMGFVVTSEGKKGRLG